MQKTIVLTSLPLSKKKLDTINEFRLEAFRVLNKYILPIIDDVEDSSGLQTKVYHIIRSDSFLHCQVILNMIHCSMNLKEKPKDKRNVRMITLDFNLPRAGKIYIENGTLYLKAHLGRKTFVNIPIKKNRMTARMQNHIDTGWKPKQFSISTRGKILVAMEKRKTKIEAKNLCGIDINSNNIALTIINPKGKILKQIYLGYGVWNKKYHILKHRDKLKSLAATGSTRAITSLRNTKNKLSNFTKNNTGELAKEIHIIALKYNAKIVLERLNKFEAKFDKKSNRQIGLIPFDLLNKRIITRSIDTGVPLSYIDSYHTSKWCPSCGSVNLGHISGNYAMYHCRKCNLRMNSDRKASYVIAIKKLVERNFHMNPNFMFQSSTGGVPVNALFRRDEEVVGNGMFPT